MFFQVYFVDLDDHNVPVEIDEDLRADERERDRWKKIGSTFADNFHTLYFFPCRNWHRMSELRGFLDSNKLNEAEEEEIEKV